jgi:hypothetical protein
MPRDFFFHAMAGREGLIDSRASKHWVYPMMIGQSSGGRYGVLRWDLVQWIYGENGTDGAFIDD